MLVFRLDLMVDETKSAEVEGIVGCAGREVCIYLDADLAGEGEEV